MTKSSCLVILLKSFIIYWNRERKKIFQSNRQVGQRQTQTTANYIYKVIWVNNDAGNLQRMLFFFFILDKTLFSLFLGLLILFTFHWYGQNWIVIMKQHCFDSGERLMSGALMNSLSIWNLKCRYVQIAEYMRGNKDYDWLLLNAFNIGNRPEVVLRRWLGLVALGYWRWEQRQLPWNLK